MLRFRIRELIAEKEKVDGTTLTIIELAKATGIHRATIYRMMNEEGYSTVTSNLEKLCNYFDCKIEALIEYENMNKKVRRRRKSNKLKP
jgi:putative transcriptional regulator